MYPPFTTATNFVPSEDDATPYQSLVVLVSRAIAVIGKTFMLAVSPFAYNVMDDVFSAPMDAVPVDKENPLMELVAIPNEEIVFTFSAPIDAVAVDIVAFVFIYTTVVNVYICPKYTPVTIFMPSEDNAIPIQVEENARVVQDTPLSVDVYMNPPSAPATNIVPSEDEAMPLQPLTTSRAVQVTPLSVDVYIYSPSIPAANFVPSADDATSYQFLIESRAVQDTPLSVDVYICPAKTTATNFVPSADDATPVQLLFDSRAIAVIGNTFILAVSLFAYNVMDDVFSAPIDAVPVDKELNVETTVPLGAAPYVISFVDAS
jgi:hypothetical protein